MARLKPLTELDSATCNQLVGVVCDIDDTLTWKGRLVPEAFTALHRLREAGLLVVPVTGRPGGWVDQIARLWPVDGVVGENGGLWYWMGPTGLQRRFLQPEADRVANRKRLHSLGEHILSAVPGTALASDQPYRELDLAIDFCEDVARLDDNDIDRIVACFDEAGATSKVSSIHVNGWFGDFDKFSGFRGLLRDQWQQAAEDVLERWIYVGDSANDAPMFGAFPNAVGVANVTAFLERMDHHPTWVTPSNGGHGFAELAAHILNQR